MLSSVAQAYAGHPKLSGHGAFAVRTAASPSKIINDLICIIFVVLASPIIISDLNEIGYNTDDSILVYPLIFTKSLINSI